METTASSKEKELKSGKELFKEALHLAKTPIIISLLVTPIRFLLELAGLPENYIFIIGLLWLALGFAIYWGIILKNEKQPYLTLLLSLIIFSPVSRFTVFIAWWIDKKWEIGTHYGLYFDNWAPALLNHVVYGALVQIIPGFLIGSLTLAVSRNRITPATTGIEKN